jgi:hypothetical protein
MMLRRTKQYIISALTRLLSKALHHEILALSSEPQVQQHFAGY